MSTIELRPAGPVGCLQLRSFVVRTKLGLTNCLSVCQQVFTLPKVSAKTKFKLTAHEGCRVRKVALATFASVISEDYAETCLACLTNLGDVHVFSVPGLRPQVHYSCIRKEDISGIASCVFTRHGQGEAGQAGNECWVRRKPGLCLCTKAAPVKGWAVSVFLKCSLAPFSRSQAFT